MAAAKGELKPVEAAKEPTRPPTVTPFLVRDNTRKPEQKAKSRTLVS
jgi:hypothetical protein